MPVGGVFLFASVAFYTALRYRSSYEVLSFAFVLFSLAFLLVGIPTLDQAKFAAYHVHHSITLLAASLYAAASASFFALFSLNFGLEAGTESRVPISRAWAIQGLASLWTTGASRALHISLTSTALWYVGFQLSYRPASDWCVGRRCDPADIDEVRASLDRRHLHAHRRGHVRLRRRPLSRPARLLPHLAAAHRRVRLRCSVPVSADEPTQLLALAQPPQARHLVPRLRGRPQLLAQCTVRS